MYLFSIRRQEEDFVVLKNAGCFMLLQNQKDTMGSPGDWQLANQETAPPPPLRVRYQALCYGVTCLCGSAWPTREPSQPTKAPTLICQKVLCSETNAASPSPHLRPSIMDVCFHFKKTNELFRWRKDLMDCLLRSFRGRSRAAAHSDDHKRMFIILV